MTTFGETTIYDVREVADEPSTITAVEAPAPVDIVATPAAPDPGDDGRRREAAGR